MICFAYSVSIRVELLRFLEARLMSQVYESEKDHVEGIGLDSRVDKSCILDNHCELGLVEHERLETHYFS